MRWTFRGSNPGGSEIFLRQSGQAVGIIQPPVQWVPGLFPGGKAAGAWRCHPQSRAEVT